jgi:hypothetical protein
VKDCSLFGLLGQASRNEAVAVFQSFIRIDGRREKLVRPRVRRRTTTGATEEVTLSTYDIAKDPAQTEASIVAALKVGRKQPGSR